MKTITWLRSLASRLVPGKRRSWADVTGLYFPPNPVLEAELRAAREALEADEEWARTWGAVAGLDDDLGPGGGAAA